MLSCAWPDIGTKKGGAQVAMHIDTRKSPRYIPPTITDGETGMDNGNSAMLSANARHNDSMYGNKCPCAGCADPVNTDNARAWDGDEYYCEWCLEKYLERWAYDFVTEALFEDEGEKPVFSFKHV